MMNPRRLSTVPAPWLRSVILATGVVGLLGAFGPAAIQNTGAAPPKDISAPSSPANRGSPGHRSQAQCPMAISIKPDVAMAELSLAGAGRRRIDRCE